MIGRTPLYSKLESQVLDDIADWWFETNPFNEDHNDPTLITPSFQKMCEKYWEEHL